MTRGPSTTRSRAQWSLREAFGVLKDTPEMLLEELEASKRCPVTGCTSCPLEAGAGEPDAEEAGCKDRIIFSRSWI